MPGKYMFFRGIYVRQLFLRERKIGLCVLICVETEPQMLVHLILLTWSSHCFADL